MLRNPIQRAALAALAACVPAWAQESGVPRLLLDRRLQERPVMLLGLDQGLVRYTDAAGLVRSEPVGEVMAILPRREIPEPAVPVRASTDHPDLPPPTMVRPPVEPERPAAGPILELTDGQRFAGGPASSGEGETLAWSHPALGVLRFKLDQVLRIRLHEGPWTPLAEPVRDDLLILANGDRLVGFVEEIGETGLTFAPAQGAPRELLFERVHEVHLANPAAESPTTGAVAWLRDGSVIACRLITTSRLGELTLHDTLQDSEAQETPAESPGSPALRLDDLLGVSFHIPGASLVPLATIPPAEQAPAPDRRWTPPMEAVEPERAVLGAADLVLPGPMSVTWDLPAGAARFVAGVELPRQAWTWGDCEIVVAADGAATRELFRQRLNAEAPAAQIAVSVQGARRLTIRVEAASLGAVQDRVLILRPLLLVGSE